MPSFLRSIRLNPLLWRLRNVLNLEEPSLVGACINHQVFFPAQFLSPLLSVSHDPS